MISCSVFSQNSCAISCANRCDFDCKTVFSTAKSAVQVQSEIKEEYRRCAVFTYLRYFHRQVGRGIRTLGLRDHNPTL